MKSRSLLGLNPGLFLALLCVTPLAAASADLVEIEAEGGTLGASFGTGSIDGVGYIGISTTSTDQTVPGSSARVASYTVTFPEAAAYNLYARVRVGPDPYNDDSFFYGNGFGSKSPTVAADWVPQVFTGLATIGFTGPNEVVTAGGGSATNSVWKWLRFGTAFTVNSGALSQTFQVGGRENGFFMDRFVFAPSDLALTVAELESGIIDPPVSFSGPDGIAIHRFGEFNGGRTADGANPSSGLALVGSDLIGTTLAGGNNGDGVAFRVSLDGGTFEALTSFDGGLNGAHPQGDFIESGGVIIGASAGGGTNGTGAIFQRAANGTVTRLHGFAALSEHTASNTGGAVPNGPLATAGGNIYGAATAGGAFGNGTIFSISTAGTGFTVLHQFGELDSRYGTNADGAMPNGGVVLAGGRLFGTTMAGGNAGSGVVFSMASDGGDFTVLHHFAALDTVTATNSGGAMPSAGLTVSNDILYGTTLAGGAGGSGSVFAIRTSGADFTSIFAFPALDPTTGMNTDGARPAARLALSGNVLYGVTARGGAGGTGTVFALDTALSDFRTLHAFEPLAADATNRFGAHPVAPLSHIGPGLYGTTDAGGPGTTGTVFRIPIPISTEVSATRKPNHTTDSIFVSRGAPFQTYLIQGSNDLKNWDDLVTQPADASGIVTVPETGLIGPARFYRLAEP